MFKAPLQMFYCGLNLDNVQSYLRYSSHLPAKVYLWSEVKYPTVRKILTYFFHIRSCLISFLLYSAHLTRLYQFSNVSSFNIDNSLLKKETTTYYETSAYVMFTVF